MITKKDLLDYQKLSKTDINLFNVEILYEIYSNDDSSSYSEEVLLDIANIIRECYIKDDTNQPLSIIVEGVLENYNYIKENNVSSRNILFTFL